MSVWGSVELLADWVYGSMHREVLRQRRAWFDRVEEATVALWWVPAGHRPSTDEAEDRVRQLRASGPTSAAFNFREVFAPPDDGRSSSGAGRPDWLCPA